MLKSTKKLLTKVKVLKSESNNPYFNIAFENYLFEKGDSSCPTLFLWRNSKSVIIGKNQNP